MTAILRDPANCKRCRLRKDEEMFTADVDGAGEHSWLVARAHEILAGPPGAAGAGEGRERVEMPRRALAETVANNMAGIEAGHVDHVDPAEPGIAVQMRISGEWRMYLIDGYHRAANALATGRPFLVDVLTRAESDEVLVWAPGRPIDWAKLGPERMKKVRELLAGGREAIAAATMEYGG